ncbi:MAG: AsnC family transcriptional regulator [Anaerolineales bacterium]|nr:AsnC family transcriptional regulator [Anaerolineales bacterium]
MPPRKINFDTLDYQIISELHSDARIAASDIARRIGANERTVRKRIDRLVSDGVLRLTAIIDPQAFGYIITTDIFLEADPNQEAAIIKRLQSMPEITYIAVGLDSSEISIEARFKDNEELRNFLLQVLPSMPGVTLTRYALVPRILRNIDEWTPTEKDFGNI